MKKWNIYILALLLLSACTEEEVFVPESRAGNDPGAMTLSLKFPQSSSATKAFSVLDENRVNTLEIFVFTGGGTTDAMDDKFLYSIPVPSGSIVDSVADGSIKKVSITLKSMKERQRLILLANKPSGAVLSPADTVPGVTSLRTIVDKLKFSGAPWRKDNVSTPDPAFPMWGQRPDSLLIYPTNPSLPSKIEVNMLRAVAKIDVGIDMDGSDPALGFGKTFKIDSVYLCHSSDSGYIAPHTDYLVGMPKVGATGVEYPRPATNRINYVGYKFPDNQSGIVRTIYTPEADTLKGTYNPAFLIIKAQYNSSTYYYRIDFAQDGKYKALLRNNSYQVNIVGVRGEGYKFLHDAFTAPVSPFNYKLNLGGVEQKLDESITNEKYSLAYEKEYIYLDWNKTLNTPVMTDFPGGWKASATGDISFSGKTGVAGTVNYITHAIGNNTTGQPRTFTIQLSAGELSKEIIVVQSSGSNSYIASVGGSVQIPVASANSVGDILGSASDYKIQILWQNGSNISLGSPTDNLSKSSILNITSGASAGNAVVALTKKGGGIGMVGGIAPDSVVWSWHVWVTNYNPSTAIAPSNNGYNFMDRNLGAAATGATASAYGLYYQWGRKDPFITGQFITEVPTSDNLDVAVKSPNIFYTPAVSPYDWTGTTQYNSLWNTSGGEKGPYDPCPFGWRVPPAGNGADSPWNGFTGNSYNGITLPLAGGLRMSDGQLSEAGSQGYAWSSSSSGSEAAVFKFTAGMAVQAQSYRANAYPVRCVKDEKR